MRSDLQVTAKVPSFINFVGLKDNGVGLWARGQYMYTIPDESFAFS
jgi:hypothetical protein